MLQPFLTPNNCKQTNIILVKSCELTYSLCTLRHSMETAANPPVVLCQSFKYIAFFIAWKNWNGNAAADPDALFHVQIWAFLSLNTHNNKAQKTVGLRRELKLNISHKVVDRRLNTLVFQRRLISLRRWCVRDCSTPTDSKDGSGYYMGPLKVTESNIHPSISATFAVFNCKIIIIYPSH